MLRKIVFWSHLVLGLAAGLVVLMMSVTGVVLTFEKQLNEWSRRGYRAEPRAHAAPMPVDELLEAVAATEPELTVSSLTLDSDPLEPASVGFGRGNTRYADRYTGKVLGDDRTPMRRFMLSVMYWHRWFALTGDSRATGKAVTGAANLAFLFLVLSGIYLWWPRSWSPAALRNVLWFRSGLGGKARDFNWHNVIGFWSWLPLVVIVASGVVISYPWAGELVYTLTGTSPATGTEDETVPGPPPGFTQPVSLDSVVSHAATDAPGWQSLTLLLPETDWQPVTVSVDTSPGRQPSKRTDLVYDRATCDLLERKPFTEESAGRRLRSWLRFAHTGEVYGIVGQSVAGVATAGSIVLVWTGFALAWRRFFRKGRS